MGMIRELIDFAGRRWTVILPWAFTPAGRGSTLIFESEDGELRYGGIPIDHTGDIDEELMRRCLERAVRVD